MPLITADELVKAGVHFGHRASRWNPRMAPYIYGKRNLIHIVDLRQTLRGLVAAYKFVVQLARDGKQVVFVGTKRQARNIVKEQAERCGMHFVNERWLGGMLTNFRTIRQRLNRLIELESLAETGEIHQYSKKMISMLNREQRKIKRNLDGVRKMTQLPSALVVIDSQREHIAIQEARKLKIPTVCLADTNCDPDVVDILIPGNDDAIKAIRIVCTLMADAMLLGERERSARLGEITPLAPKPQAAAPQAPAEAAPEPPAEAAPEPPAEAAPEPPAEAAPEAPAEAAPEAAQEQTPVAEAQTEPAAPQPADTPPAEAEAHDSNS